ncbi:MAG: hypothetical protein WC994_09910 [Brumimicrobium sp.]
MKKTKLFPYQLNLIPSAIFAQIVAKVEETENKHLKFDNSSRAFMPLSVEFLQDVVLFGEKTAKIFSFSHYYKQNGDLVPDPDMTFLFFYSENQPIVLPCTFQDNRIYQEAIFMGDAKKWQVNVKLAKSLASFSNIWLKNIKEQQEL